MTEDERETYLHGRCCTFALAMARETGLPMRAALCCYDDTGQLDYIVHAWVEAPDGRMLDAAGLRNVDLTLENDYGDDVVSDVVDVDAEFLAKYGEDVTMEAMEDLVALASPHAREVLETIGAMPQAPRATP